MNSIKIYLKCSDCGEQYIEDGDNFCCMCGIDLAMRPPVEPGGLDEADDGID